MMRKALWLFLCVAVGWSPRTMGQDETNEPKLFSVTLPRQSLDLGLIQAQSDAGVGLKTFTYHATSTRKGSKGQKYTGIMVGSDPYSNTGTTTITMQIVPLIVDINGTVFNPTVPDHRCAAGKVPLTLLQQSPMVLPYDFQLNGVDVGRNQYSDAFQRANFWEPISKNGGGYHTRLKVVTLDAVKVNPGSNGKVILQEPCGPFAEVNITWLDNYITTQLIPSLAGKGVGPRTFPVIMLYNTAINYYGECCVGGYHFHYGSPAQTYAAFLFDLTGAFGHEFQDTALIAHEVAEWMDDPLVTNATPSWGHTGQVTSCQANLEVGDPLSGTDIPEVTMPNGYTYHLQELAFFSWFFGPPSIGAGGKFSDNGTFTSAQGACH